MGKFKFNKHNVCVNPNRIERKERLSSFSIKTALGRYERWVFGYDCYLPGIGCGTPCRDKAQYPIPSYPTEKKAIKAACKEIRKFLAKNTTGNDPNKAERQIELYDKKFILMLDEIEKPRPKQLSLFGVEC